MNTQSITQISDQIASPLQAIASPARIAILLTIGTGEACVCHLEAALGWRQAYISQHLMGLRKAGILRDRRDGRFMYYRLANESILDIVLAAVRLIGIDPEIVNTLINTKINSSCECPHCADNQIPVSGAFENISNLFES